MFYGAVVPLIAHIHALLLSLRLLPRLAWFVRQFPFLVLDLVFPGAVFSPTQHAEARETCLLIFDRWVPKRQFRDQRQEEEGEEGAALLNHGASALSASCPDLRSVGGNERTPAVSADSKTCSDDSSDDDSSDGSEYDEKETKDADGSKYDGKGEEDDDEDDFLLPPPPPQGDTSDAEWRRSSPRSLSPTPTRRKLESKSLSPRGYSRYHHHNDGDGGNRTRKSSSFHLDDDERLESLSQRLHPELRRRPPFPCDDLPSLHNLSPEAEESGGDVRRQTMAFLRRNFTGDDSIRLTTLFDLSTPPPPRLRGGGDAGGDRVHWRRVRSRNLMSDLEVEAAEEQQQHRGGRFSSKRNTTRTSRGPAARGARIIQQQRRRVPPPSIPKYSGTPPPSGGETPSPNAAADGLQQRRVRRSQRLRRNQPTTTTISYTGPGASL